jgi:hypothetical protein
MKLTMLLADAAQAVDGKLFILGGGWSITGPDATPSAIAIKIDVPWTEANKRHRLELALFDEDGHPVSVQTPIGDRPIQITGDFEVGRPPGLKPGTDLGVVLAINIGPFPLLPGRGYVWTCSINGQTRDEWRVSFMTRTAQPQAGPEAIPPVQ